MVDAQTVYELKLALKKSGCPVCTLLQRSGAKYIENTFYESMLDPHARQKIVDSLGFCYQHAWLIADLKLSDALGQAIVYKDIVADLLERLNKHAGADGRQLAEKLTSKAICPACQIEATSLERINDALIKSLNDFEFSEEYLASDGLCLPHTRLLLPKLDRPRIKILLNQRINVLETLKQELAEFIRKNDYRFQHESMGVEGDSYLRAAAMLVGKRRPAKKQDLS
jgi:hypothetical protein